MNVFPTGYSPGAIERVDIDSGGARQFLLWRNPQMKKSIFFVLGAFTPPPRNGCGSLRWQALIL